MEASGGFALETTNQFVATTDQFVRNDGSHHNDKRGHSL